MAADPLSVAFDHNIQLYAAILYRDTMSMICSGIYNGYNRYTLYVCIYVNGQTDINVHLFKCLFVYAIQAEKRNVDVRSLLKSLKCKNEMCS